MRFAEILDGIGRRIHIGCIMAAGRDWVEVSCPQQMQFESGLSVRFLPAQDAHGVTPEWRSVDRVGFTYSGGGPPEEQFVGLAGLLDPRPAYLRKKA